MSSSTLTTERQIAGGGSQPLVVDLDGSLVRTDTLIECFVAALSHPLKLARALLELRRGRAALKAALAEIAPPDPALLPYNRELLAFLREEQRHGRPLILATAADRRIALAVAQHLDLFDAVLASDGDVNLAGPAKRAAIEEALGRSDFSYVGNEHRDLAVWRDAASAVTVDATPRLQRAVARVAPIERSFPRDPARALAILRAMRPHQWVKNLLVFVPIVTARAVGDVGGWAEAFLAFWAFSLTASGIYLINDLCDLAADRQHPKKCERPFASGVLPPQIGLIFAPLLMIAGFSLGAAAGVWPVLAAYAVLSLGYSFFLKSQPLVDVFALAGLYTIRLIGGGIASGYAVSLWLLAFSSFLFLALAIVKRVAELQASAKRERRGPARLEGAVKGDEHKIAGRGYLASDTHILELMGVAASFVTALVLALYVQSELTPAGDHRPTLAWGIVPLILFWQCRIWFVTLRGEMHHDPIVYAARDWVSWVVTVAAFAMLLLSSHGAMTAV
ncbi:MAG TPA: UbiA family prenyltransferase [Stellaceae bacterium]|nr:UbiA family prenyltransferase [Stellaceae bacterium]